MYSVVRGLPVKLLQASSWVEPVAQPTNGVIIVGVWVGVGVIFGVGVGVSGGNENGATIEGAPVPEGHVWINLR